MGSGSYGQRLWPLRVCRVSTVGGTWVGTLLVCANVLELLPKTDQRSVDICHLVIFVHYQFIVIFYCFCLSSVLIAVLTDIFLSSILLLSIMLRTIAAPARQSRIYTTIEASQNAAVRRINYRESHNLLL